MKSQFKQKYVRLHLSVTRDCNLACGYCYVSKESRNLNLDVAKRILPWISEQYPNLLELDMTLLGGEPLIVQPLLKELIPLWRKQSQDLGFQLIISIITNGTLLNEELLFWSVESVDTITISIDGSKKTNDSFRVFNLSKKGSWEIVVNNLKSTLKHHPRVGTISVVQKHTINSFYDSINELYSLGVRNVFYQPLFPPTEEWSKQDFTNFKDQLLNLGDLWIKSQLTQRPLRVITWLAIFRHIIGLVDNKRRCTSNFFFVTEEGDIFHCNDIEVMSRKHNIDLGPKASILQPPSKDWIEYWARGNESSCKGCQISNLCSDYPSYFPSFTDRFFDIEESVCIELLDRVKDKDWFRSFMSLKG